jgi:hypothetical protein
MIPGATLKGTCTFHVEPTGKVLISVVSKNNAVASVHVSREGLTEALSKLLTISLDTVTEAAPPRCRAAYPEGVLATLRKSILSLRAPGQSFGWHEYKLPHRAAEQLGVRITARKVNGEGIRIYRTFEEEEWKR